MPQFNSLETAINNQELRNMPKKGASCRIKDEISCGLKLVFATKQNKNSVSTTSLSPLSVPTSLNCDAFMKQLAY